MNKEAETETTTIAWTDTLANYCTCDAMDCGRLHENTSTLPDRFAFWVKGQKRDTYYATATLESFTIDLTTMATTAPFRPGEAIVKDLATGDTMDAAEWLAR